MAVTIKIHEIYTASYGRGDPIYFPPDKDSKRSYAYISEIKSKIEEFGGKTETSYSGHRQGGYGIDGIIGGTVVTDITAIIASLGGAAATLKIIGDVIVAWINNRSNRSVTIKSGDKTIEIKGHSDIDEALRLIERLDGGSHNASPPSNGPAHNS